MRADERTKLIPVVVLTTTTEDEEVKRGYELGANSFVQKVADFKDFIEIVRRLGMYWLIVNQPLPEQ